MAEDKNAPSEIVSLEKEFQSVIADLTDDPNLTRFRIEYEKVHEALKKSISSNERLQRQCRELNAEIVSNSAKVAHAVKLSQDDQVNFFFLNFFCQHIF